ncbi:hypothetical protein B5X24_HaOG207188 [Helicoverpa armigera]|nr:hypothetical protein B5X24_HaOG207188 [Helicoverpa armigera]
MARHRYLIYALVITFAIVESHAANTQITQVSTNVYSRYGQGENTFPRRDQSDGGSNNMAAEVANQDQASTDTSQENSSQNIDQNSGQGGNQNKGQGGNLNKGQGEVMETMTKEVMATTIREIIATMIEEVIAMSEVVMITMTKTTVETTTREIIEEVIAATNDEVIAITIKIEIGMTDNVLVPELTKTIQEETHGGIPDTFLKENMVLYLASNESLNLSSEGSLRKLIPSKNGYLAACRLCTGG